MAITQNQGGIEQYYYTGNQGRSTLISKIFYENNKKWYAEGRYNYEEKETFSLIGGKVFSKKGTNTYSVTPMTGLAFGKFKGALFALKTEMNQNRLFFSSESQYSLSVDYRNRSFFYNWSDLLYQAKNWIYFGAAMQMTIIDETPGRVEPGIFIGFALKKWTLPVYIFDPANQNRYFVLGVGYELGSLNSKLESKKMIHLN